MDDESKVHGEARPTQENAANDAKPNECALQESERSEVQLLQDPATLPALVHSVAIIRQADVLLADPNFNPEVLFAAVEAVREKVDGIAFYDDEYKWRIEAAEGRIRQMQTHLSALRNNHERLKGYAKHCLEQSGGDELPGHEFRVVLQNAQASVRITKDAVTAADYLEHPTLIRQIPRKYEPDKAAIREALETGQEVPFAELVPSTYVRFYPARVGKKKPKKVPESKTKKLKEGKAS